MGCALPIEQNHGVGAESRLEPNHRELAKDRAVLDPNRKERPVYVAIRPCFGEIGYRRLADVPADVHRRTSLPITLWRKELRARSFIDDVPEALAVPHTASPGDDDPVVDHRQLLGREFDCAIGGSVTHRDGAVGADNSAVRAQDSDNGCHGYRMTLFCCISGYAL